MDIASVRHYFARFESKWFRGVDFGDVLLIECLFWTKSIKIADCKKRIEIIAKYMNLIHCSASKEKKLNSAKWQFETGKKIGESNQN